MFVGSRERLREWFIGEDFGGGFVGGLRLVVRGRAEW